MVHFSYNLPLLMIDDNTTKTKQIIKFLEFKNYLLVRMQCKGQGYMMLKDTTRKHLWKLILPLQMSPCNIMDLSLPLTP